MWKDLKFWMITQTVFSGDTARVSKRFGILRRNFWFWTAQWNQATFTKIKIKFWIGSDRNRIYIMSAVQSRKVFSWFIGYKAPLVQNFICPENLRWRHKRIFSRLALIIKLKVFLPHKCKLIFCCKTLTWFSQLSRNFTFEKEVVTHRRT